MAFEFRPNGVETFARHVRTSNDGRVFEERAAREVREFLFDEVGHALFDEIDFRHDHETAGQPEDAHDLEVLARLRHHGVVGGDDEHDDVESRRTRHHVSDEPFVPGNVDETDLTSGGRRVFRVPQIDRESALAFFLESIGIRSRQRFDEARLSMVDMARGADHRAEDLGNRLHRRDSTRGDVPGPCYRVRPMLAPPLWNLLARNHEAETALMGELRCSRVLATLLVRRELADPKEARAWLDPALTDLEDPLAIVDMQRGADRLAQAIRDKEPVLIYGDYDVDGMTGTSLLVNFLRLAGVPVEWFIPDRTRDGYSFSDGVIDRFIARPVRPRIVITVDHGTSAHAGIARLVAAGIDVVVTDHHEPPPELPTGAVALINPKRRDDRSRARDLCGAAVAFKLAWATAQSFGGSKKVAPEFRDFLVDAMGFVTLATIADVVKLRGDNRTLCAHGLRVIPHTRSPGLKALLQSAGLEGQSVKARTVAFKIAPRLNAAGRLGRAEEVVRLLTTKDTREGESVAAGLEKANEERRSIDKAVLEDAERMLKRRGGVPPGEGICLGAKDWHSGVIGIVAARLVDRYHVPTLLIALNGDEGRGSARAPEGFHLKEALDACGDHLVGWGGHAGAAGCTVTEAAWPALRERFIAFTREKLAAAPLRPTWNLETLLRISDVTTSLTDEIDRMAPFGSGNPMPLFLFRDIRVAGVPSVMGDGGAHLQFMATDGESALRAVCFGAGSRVRELEARGARFALAAHVKFDTYKGAGSLQLEVKDFRLDDGAPTWTP